MFGVASIGSAPAAGADGAGEQFVFWQGTDGRLWERRYVRHVWSAATPVTVAGQIASAPAVAAQPGGEQDVFWKGRDGKLWEAWYTHGWHAVSLGGGPLGSAPAAGADGAGEQFVV